MTRLKRENRPALWTVMAANGVLALALTGFTPVQPIAALQGQGALAQYVAPALGITLVGVANALVPSSVKAQLIFMRRRNALPGCRAFSRYCDDPRIDKKSLIARYGRLPQAAKKQNALWFTMYNLHKDLPAVLDAHGSFLLYRDAATISLLAAPVIFAVMWACASPTAASWMLLALGVQLGVMTVAARNRGIALVQNVLAAESAALKGET